MKIRHHGIFNVYELPPEYDPLFYPTLSMVGIDIAYFESLPKSERNKIYAIWIKCLEEEDENHDND